MNISFLSPIFLMGLLGISVPILIHLLTRRQQKQIRFSAIYLLLRSQKRSIKKATPNRLWLLIIRCLAIILLSLALANPIFSFGTAEDLVSSKTAANVFILDDSFSMASKMAEGSRYSTAVTTLLQIIEKLPAGSEYALVQASSPGRILLEWNRDLKKAGKILTTSEPSFRTTSIGQGMSVALSLLESTRLKKKRIFILTDMEKNGWQEKDFQNVKGTTKTPVKILDLSGQDNEVNQIAVKTIKVYREFLTNSRVIRVKAEISNLSTGRSINRLPISLWINGKKKSDDFVKIPPTSSTEKEFSFPYLENEPIKCFVQIGDDPLLSDNIRYFTFHPDRNLKVLLVDGDPKTVSHQSETFYTENALNPFSVALSNILPTVSTLQELPRRNLQDFSLVIFANVRELPFDYNRQLEKFVLNGGAVFFALGDQVSPKYYNEKLGNLLPVDIESLHLVKDLKNSFQLDLESTDHPVLKVFKGKTLKEMQDIRFTGLYKVAPKPNRELTIPLWFKNKYPALIETKYGKGRVILYVSSLDRDWNNFPIQPTFLPWIQRWVKYSAGGLDSILRRDMLVGEPFINKRNGHQDQGYVQTPGGQVHLLQISDQEEIFTETWRPGVYSLFRGKKPAVKADPSEPPKPLLKLPGGVQPTGAFTINVDTLESHPEKISQENVRDRLGEMRVEFISFKALGSPASGSTGNPLITPLLLLVAGMMFWEAWMVRAE